MSKPVLVESHVVVCGLPNTLESKVIDFCECCKLSNSTRKPRHALKLCSAKCSLNRVYSDLVGPIETESVRGFRFFVTLLDEYSVHSLVRFVKRKSMAAEAVQKMIACLETLLRVSVENIELINLDDVRWFRTDGGGEYTEKDQ